MVLPATLAEVLLVRIQALTGPAQELLRAAAVAGRRVRHRLLAQVVGWSEPELEETLRETIGAGVLVADASTETYAFRHALLQEAVYGDLLPSEQVRLHAAYARLLAEADGAAAELAYHCLASHDLAGALAASVRAAQESATVLAPTETLRHLSSALKLWERVPEPAGVTGTDRIDLTLRAAEAAAAAGEEHQAAALAQDAATTADATADAARAARAHERCGRYLLHADHAEEALHAQASAVALVPAQPPTRLRRVTAAMAQTLIDVGRPEKARGWCEEALALSRAVGSADDEADALITLGRIQHYADLANARSLYVAGRRRAAGAGNLEIEARALEELAWLDEELGNLAAAGAEPRDADLDAMLGGPGVGDVGRPRWWTLRSESLEILPTGAWRVTATLTATRTFGLVEVLLEVDPEASDGDWLVLQGHGVLDRHPLGIGRSASTRTPPIRLDLSVRARRAATSTTQRQQEEKDPWTTSTPG